MRINDSGILVIEYEELISSGFKYETIKKSITRGIFQSTRAHRGQPAEIVWSSLPARYQEAFILKYGDPKEVLRAQALEHYLKPDSTAREYYRGYVAGNHKYLPEEHVNKYSAQAQWLEVAISISNATKEALKQMGFGTKKEAFESLFNLQAYQESGLPCNYSKLCGKVRAFLPTNNDAGAARNYGSLVSAKFGNKNTEKIGEEQRRWLLAMYANPALKHDVNSLYREFNAECLRRGWKHCENPVSMHLWLNKPENKLIWWGAKYGERKGRVQHSYVMRTALPTMRDSLWYSDGTKLNFFDNAGKLRAAYTVYEVMDAYSEVLLGFSIVKGAENFQAQYTAYKMAMQVAGYKPYEIKYDNQGGHKLLEAQSFFGKIAHLNVRTMPYNGRSKTIESAFGRFQNQLMARHWFFTGQNITTKRDSSKANREFIGKNLKHLPTIEELVQIYTECRDEWNNSTTDQIGRECKARIAKYQESFNPETPAITTLDMVDLFWFEKPEPITYWNSGITIQFKDIKHEYEVLTADGYPDVDFRATNVMAKFIVKYDPENLSYIRLFEPNTRRFVAIAQPRLTIQRNIQEQQPGERSRIDALLNVSRTETDNRKQLLEKLWEEMGISPEEIVANGGKPAPIRKELETVLATEAQVQKEESYMDEADFFNKW